MIFDKQDLYPAFKVILIIHEPEVSIEYKIPAFLEADCNIIPGIETITFYGNDDMLLHLKGAGIIVLENKPNGASIKREVISIAYINRYTESFGHRRDNLKPYTFKVNLKSVDDSSEE